MTSGCVITDNSEVIDLGSEVIDLEQGSDDLERCATTAKTEIEFRNHRYETMTSCDKICHF